GRSGGLPRSVGARRAAGARGAGAGAAVSREAGGICAEARGGAELSGDGRRDGRAHPDAQDARASRARSTVARIGGPRMNPIDPRIHQALDGEIARGNLPADLRGGPMLGEHEGIAQFVGRFPGARSVHVVGSFNDWRTGTIALEGPDHDGVWRGALVLPAGTYEYMFVVDGERWIPDHLAEREVADNFGRENSIVIVRAVRRGGWSSSSPRSSPRRSPRSRCAIGSRAACPRRRSPPSTRWSRSRHRTACLPSRWCRRRSKAGPSTWRRRGSSPQCR